MLLDSTIEMFSLLQDKKKIVWKYVKKYFYRHIMNSVKKTEFRQFVSFLRPKPNLT